MFRFSILICTLALSSAFSGREPNAMSINVTTEMSSQVHNLKSAFDRSLSVAAPLFRSSIQLSYIEHVGFGVNYCFEYRQAADNRLYADVKSLVLGYAGVLRWGERQEFNDHGACIWFTPAQGVKALFANEPITFVSFNDLVEDGVKLSADIKNGLSVFHYPIYSDSDAEKVANLKDPCAPGTHEIYILKNPDAGFRGTTSRTDRLLHFSPTFQEWKSLVLGLQKVDPRSLPNESFSGLDRPIDGFPLISRITSPYDRISYHSSELPDLQREYETALSMIKDANARAAITKVLSAIDWAKALDSGLLFEPRD